MSSSISEETRFHDRNDLLIYLNNDLFFGFRTGPNVTWGNLCACLDTIFLVAPDYSCFFRSRHPSIDESIPKNSRSRQTFGNCKAYDILVSYLGQTPNHPRPGDCQVKEIVPRKRTESGAVTPRSPNRTPSTGPTFPVTPSDRSGVSTPVDNQAQSREERVNRRGAGIPSPKQNKARASKAPERCWNTYRQCCITGSGPLVKNDVSKPPDINSCHIYPYSHYKLWVKHGWAIACTDLGPKDDCSHEYTGYHQICCLNNMIPLRSDIHNLWDAYEIGVDVHDNYRVISFSTGREDLAERHLETKHVDSKYRPLSQLLTDHLAQGVWKCCLFPGWKSSNQQHLAHLRHIAEEEVSNADYELQEDDFDADPANVLSARLQHLVLDQLRTGGGGAQFEQRSVKRWESGNGKSYFEKYLDAALSVWGEEGLTLDV